MANELNYKSGITGQTITAKTMLLGATTLSAPISCPEIAGTVGEYSGDMSGAAGNYSVSFYESGNIVDSGVIDWDGTQEITALSINSKTVNLPSDPASNTQVNTRTATNDSRFNFLDASIAARPTNPLLTTDVRLDNIDVATSTRMASFAYTAPDNAGVAAIKTVTDQITFTGANVNSNSQVVTDKTGYNVASINNGVITQAVAPNLDATISSRSTVNADNATIATIATNTDSIESRLPAALVGGKMDSTATDITAITNVLPTGGVKISGEGTVVKNLDQLPTVSSIVTGIFTNVIETGETFIQNIRIVSSIIKGTTTGIGTSIENFKSKDKTKIRYSVEFNSNGDRLNTTEDGD